MVAAESIHVAVNPDYRAIVVAVDVSDPSSVRDMVARAIAEFGRIDYCVNSAGVSMEYPPDPQLAKTCLGSDWRSAPTRSVRVFPRRI
jgi:NAD(P)-dependent dehydrogenase (short-subunit alcohol dehydrogenase family)